MRVQSRSLPLDGLRGAAALLVVFYHFAAVAYPAALSGDPALAHGGWDVALHASLASVLLDGDFDVAVFFVLSGYVLTRDAFEDAAVLRRRAVARLPRLALPAGASTLAVFALLHAGAYRLQAAQALSGADAVFDSHLVFAFPWDAASLADNLLWRTWFAPADVARMYNLVLWTMPVELWGSMAVLAAALLLGRARLRTAALATLALVLWRAAGSSGVGLGILVGGAALASLRRPLPGGLGWGLATAGLLLGSYNDARLLGLPPGLEVVLHGLGALLLVAGVLNAPALGRALAGRWLRDLGRISFALYLVHQPVIYTLGAAVLVALAPHGYGLAAAVSLASVLAVSLLVAVAAERWIDRPATRLARRCAETALRC